MNSLYSPLIRVIIKSVCIFLSIIFSNVLLAQPVITGFSPASGPVGTTVTISGSGFDNSISGNIVRFGAVKATVTVASSQSLTVVVPSGATYEPITVTSNTLTGYSNQRFNITFPGAIAPFNTTSFSPNIDVPATATTNLIAIGDINGDNTPDVLTIDPGNGSTWLDVFVNNSTITKMAFQKNTLSATVSANCLALGDLDGDGRTDVALDGRSSGIAIFKNNSNGSTVTLNRVLFFGWTKTNAIALLIRDLDSDGKPDLAALNIDSNTISLYKNTTTNGVISFADKVDIQTSSNPRDFCIGDIDDDGRPDLVVANSGSNTVSVLRNTYMGGGFSFCPKK